jgi:hypothetical protein
MKHFRVKLAARLAVILKVVKDHRIPELLHDRFSLGVHHV